MKNKPQARISSLISNFRDFATPVVLCLCLVQSANAVTAGPSGTVNNIVDADTTITTLKYTNLSTTGYHTTQIPTGVTLTVNGSGTDRQANWLIGDNSAQSGGLGHARSSFQSTSLKALCTSCPRCHL